MAEPELEPGPITIALQDGRVMAATSDKCEVVAPEESSVAGAAGFAMFILAVGVVLGMCCSELRRWLAREAPITEEVATPGSDDAITPVERGTKTSDDATSTVKKGMNTMPVAERCVVVPPPVITVAPRRGGRFHQAGCSQLLKSTQLVEYSPCRTCWPWPGGQ